MNRLIPPKMPSMKKLTHRQELFVLEMSRSQNLFRAAEFAQVPPEHQIAQALAFMADPGVREAIRRRISRQRPRVLPGQVLDKLWKIACADPRELVKTSRICCRHCWGKDFDYQRTRWEHKQHLKAGGEEEGGDGYDSRKPPNADCPECRGKGQIVTEVTPLEELSENAVALCAGITVLPNGLRVRTHNQLKALELVGKHLGMFGRRLHITEDLHQDMELQGEVWLAKAQEYNKDMQKKGPDRPRERRLKRSAEELQIVRRQLIHAVEQNTGRYPTDEELATIDKGLHDDGPAPEQLTQAEREREAAGLPPISYREWCEQRDEREPNPLTSPLPFSHDPIHMAEEHSGADPPQH